MAKPTKPYTTKARKDLTAEYVKSILNYCPETGIFTWRWRLGYPNSWNAKKAGKPAGYTNEIGYVYIGIHKKLYLAHRLAWLYMTGEWPTEVVDHRDGQPSNNTFSNLRQASNAQNVGCGRKRRNNTTGYTGVRKVNNKWKSLIVFEGRIMHLGYFETAEE